MQTDTVSSEEVAEELAYAESVNQTISTQGVQFVSDGAGFADEAVRSESGAGPQFVIDSRERVNWFLKLVTQKLQEMELTRQQADRRVAQLQADVDGILFKFGKQAEDYVIGLWQSNPRQKKTFVFQWGDVSLRENKDKLTFDPQHMARAADYCLEADYDDLDPDDVRPISAIISVRDDEAVKRFIDDHWTDFEEWVRSHGEMASKLFKTEVNPEVYIEWCANHAKVKVNPVTGEQETHYPLAPGMIVHPGGIVAAIRPGGKALPKRPKGSVYLSACEEE